ncbi:MAG: class I SAM-dependent methyltransferase, partial [Candidatus Aminicenantes bacterium]|nr:class I SAM-dependent methyltransferase [Candidatus Aminicenantes bacterium]
LASLHATPASYDREYLHSHFYVPLGLLGRPPRPGARLLDAGCGPGFFLRAAAENGWAGEGVEAAGKAVAYARRVVCVSVREGTFESVDFPAGAYDAVVLLEFLEHVRDPRAALEKARRLLRDGGKVIISTPDYGSLSRLLLGRNWAVLSPAEHLFCFTASTLRRLLVASGFEATGVGNLLVFNTDYTHALGSRRHLRWRNIHRRLERASWMRRVQMYEVRNILRLGGGAKRPAASGVVGRAARMFYGRLRVFLRGDMLFAVAAKKSSSGRPPAATAR